MRTINQAGLDVVKKWEGILDGDPTTVNLDPYLDPVGIWTIGWGHAIMRPSGTFVRGTEGEAEARALYPDGLTRDDAETLLAADLMETSKDVSARVKVPLTENQFAALVSFEFNTGGLSQSTLLAKLNGGDYMGATDQFGRWVKGTVKGIKVTLPGLVRRREDERRLFLT